MYYSRRQCELALPRIPSERYISDVARTSSLVFRVDPALRRDIQRIADEEQRTITQVCEMLLYEGVDAYEKEGAKFMQRLVERQKTRRK